jgi:DNA polymerase-4
MNGPMTEANETRRWSRVILHLDMDAFFALVEQVDNPALRGRPVIVGGDPSRGVVSTASYEARPYGIRSAMPMATARRLCPHGVFLPGRMHRYQEISDGIMDILRDYSPLMQQASVDEAYLDLTGSGHLFGSAREAAAQIKERIRGAYGLTCSIGLAPNKMVAKIGSDQDKPDGLTVVPPAEVLSMLSGLDVDKLPGVGPRMRSELHEIGVSKVADLRGYPERFWRGRFGQRGAELLAMAFGLDDSPVVAHRVRKSCGAEHTFLRDVASRDLLKRRLLQQSDEVGRNLRKKGLRGKTVVLKIKFYDFKQITRSKTLPRATDSTRDIYEAASMLLDREPGRRKVRLIGVSVSNFTSVPDQGTLLPDEGRERTSRIDRVLDSIRDRYGTESVFRGSLLDLDE